MLTDIDLINPTGNFYNQAVTDKTSHKQHITATTNLISQLMKTTTKELWKCDPDRYVKDETYTELTQLLQGYVQNEENLNPTKTCRDDCSDYTYTKNYEGFQTDARRCNGKVLNCKFVDSRIMICPAVSQIIAIKIHSGFP